MIPDTPVQDQHIMPYKAAEKRYQETIQNV
jgi:hypothetical protein